MTGRFLALVGGETAGGEATWYANHDVALNGSMDSKEQYGFFFINGGLRGAYEKIDMEHDDPWLDVELALRKTEKLILKPYRLFCGL